MRIAKSHPKINSYDWAKMKRETLRKYVYCVFCGGKYDSLICTVYKYPKTVACCELCYTIQHLTYHSNATLVLVRSQLKQHVIVRKFVDMFTDLNRVPTVLEIDPNAKKVDISISEYLRSVIQTDLKLFPTQCVSTDYLCNTDINMFIDENNDPSLTSSDELLSDMTKQETKEYFIALQRDDPLENVPKGGLTESEKTQLQTIFNSKNIRPNSFKEIINNYQKEITSYQILDNVYAELILKYQQDC